MTPDNKETTSIPTPPPTPPPMPPPKPPPKPPSSMPPVPPPSSSSSQQTTKQIQQAKSRSAELKDYLPVAFYFNVEILGLGKIPFKEVSGLTAEMELESVYEGGVNDLEYKLPKHIKHNNLVLKRALNIINTSTIKWINETLYNNLSKPIKLRDITISLLNQEGESIYTWVCTDAFPIKWDIESLDAEKNSILIESVEFTYKILKRL